MIITTLPTIISLFYVVSRNDYQKKYFVIFLRLSLTFENNSFIFLVVVIDHCHRVLTPSGAPFIMELQNNCHLSQKYKGEKRDHQYSQCCIIDSSE